MKTKLTISIVTVFVIASLATTSVFAQGVSTKLSSFFMPPPPGDFQLSDEALEAAAEVLGITADELSAALDAGTTLEALAETYGVDVQDVFDAIREAMPIPEFGFGGRGNPGEIGAPGNMPLSDEALVAAAEALGITVDELTAALEAGTTLEALAETAGVDIQVVFDAIRAVQPMPAQQQNGQQPGGGQFPNGQPGQTPNGQPGQMPGQTSP